MFLVWICKISSLPVESGMPMSISRSKRPAQRSQCNAFWAVYLLGHSSVGMNVPYMCICVCSHQNAEERDPRCSVCLWPPWPQHEHVVSGRPSGWAAERRSSAQPHRESTNMTQPSKQWQTSDCTQLHNILVSFSSPYLLSFRSDCIQLIDEDDSRGVFFGLLESFSQVALRLPCQFAHDFRT